MYGVLTVGWEVDETKVKKALSVITNFNRLYSESCKKNNLRPLHPNYVEPKIVWADVRMVSSVLLWRL